MPSRNFSFLAAGMFLPLATSSWAFISLMYFSMVAASSALTACL